jgi:scyllo-inositol 2-dehydrogenase (NADP+)
VILSYCLWLPLMKIQIVNPNDPQIEFALTQFFALGGFSIVANSPDLIVQYLSAKDSFDSTPTATPKIILGEGVFNNLKNFSEINLLDLTAEHEIRLRPTELKNRFEGDLYLNDKLALISVIGDGVKVAATANFKLTDYPVAFYLKQKNLFILNVSNQENLKSQALARFTRLWVNQVVINQPVKKIKVGLLAYGAIGHEHNRAVSNITGFELAAVCDSNPARIEVAKELSKDIKGFTDADKLLNSEVDLVVISTPPNSHYAWAKKALEKNKHVVLEKPMALNTAECDELIELAKEKNKTLVVYQNRRWDADFLAIKDLVDNGLAGEIFHAEIFVGGYGHPCNYWHSDQAISGGAIFDWGSHFLDQALALFGTEIKYVTAKEHKIEWLDVTNSDHARITLHYKNGLEVDFIHSDLAAALKPKYYFLGTKGAIVGEWRHEKIISRNEIGTLHEDVLAPGDSPATIKFFDKAGSITQVKAKNPPSHQFHRELADLLIDDVPMTVNAVGSRQVVAIMQAAARSAAGDGLAVSPLL